MVDGLKKLAWTGTEMDPKINIFPNPLHTRLWTVVVIGVKVCVTAMCSGSGISQDHQERLCSPSGKALDENSLSLNYSTSSLYQQRRYWSSCCLQTATATSSFSRSEQINHPSLFISFLLYIYTSRWFFSTKWCEISCVPITTRDLKTAWMQTFCVMNLIWNHKFCYLL